MVIVVGGRFHVVRAATTRVTHDRAAAAGFERAFWVILIGDRAARIAAAVPSVARRELVLDFLTDRDDEIIAQRVRVGRAGFGFINGANTAPGNT